MNGVLFGATLMELIQQLLGGGGGGLGGLMPLIAIGLAIFAIFRKPAPVPTPSPSPTPTPSNASPIDIARLEQSLHQLHAAASGAAAGNAAAFEPGNLVNLLNTVIQLWPIISFFAGLFGIKLPTLPVTPIPAPPQQSVRQ